MAIPEIERNLPLVVPAKLRGLPRRFAPRNDVFFFWRLSGAVLAHRTRRNAGDGVPYGDICRDTPPGVSAPHRCFAQGWPLISMPSAIKMCVSQKQQKLKGFLD